MTATACTVAPVVKLAGKDAAKEFYEAVVTPSAASRMFPSLGTSS
jgi:hypothetical protein